MSDKIREALQGMLDIVDDSEGVAGYHRNGVIAEWHDFPEVDVARTALAQQAATGVVPDGWQAVPAELTQEMLEKAWCDTAGTISQETICRLYISLLSAAPAAPVAVGKEPVAWMTDESWRRLRAGGNDSRGTVPVRGMKTSAAKIPLYAAPPAAAQHACDTCNGHGLVGGLKQDGYDSETCPQCAGTGYDCPAATEQTDTVKVMRHTLARYAGYLQDAGYNYAADELRSILLSGSDKP